MEGKTDLNHQVLYNMNKTLLDIKETLIENSKSDRSRRKEVSDIILGTDMQNHEAVVRALLAVAVALG